MTGQPARSTARRNAARSQRADRSPSAIRGSQAGSSVADLLERGVHTSAKLATELKVNEDALYRLHLRVRGSSRRCILERLEIPAFLATCGSMSLNLSGRHFFTGELNFTIDLSGKSFTASRRRNQPGPNSLAKVTGNTCSDTLSWPLYLTMR